jgi:hypothetical protein
MPEDDAIKKLEARLSRVEATLSQAGANVTPTAIPLGPIADPGPFGPPYYGGGWLGWRPNPVVDPATYAYSARLNAIVDPGPYPPYGGGGWRPPTVGPIGDPAVYAARVGHIGDPAVYAARVGHIGDPPPLDVSRFSIAQLEATLHAINAEKARLSSIETMVTQQLDRAKAQQE